MRFSDEVEHRKAMIDMQGAVGCGSKPLRVSAATPKRYHMTSLLSLCYSVNPFSTKHDNLFCTVTSTLICGDGLVEWIRALDLKSAGPWFKSSTLPLSGFVLGTPEFNFSTALGK